MARIDTHELTHYSRQGLLHCMINSQMCSAKRPFLSFQVIEMKSHGKPTDIYSMGCFLIELTIGVPTKDTLKEKVGTRF